MLSEKVALVTGSAGGIGRATAQQLARLGAAVVLFDIDGGGVAGAAAAINSHGGRAMAVTGDVSSESHVREAIAATRDEYGRLDILHNNAAALDQLDRDTDLLSMDVDYWDRVLAVNLRGTMLTCKHALPLMIEQGTGSIINTSSILASDASPHVWAYAASKGGINTFTRYVAVRFGPQGIRCNAVAPGVIVSHPERGGSERSDRYRRYHPMQRLGTNQDVAEVVAFLASDSSAFMTGQILAADGGLSAIQPFAVDSLPANHWRTEEGRLG